MARAIGATGVNGNGTTGTMGANGSMGTNSADRTNVAGIAARTVLAALVTLAFVAAGCRGRHAAPAPPQLIRLGTLLASTPAAGGQPARQQRQQIVAQLPAGEVTAERAYETPVDLSAAHVGRLRFELAGSARLATVSWRLTQDRLFSRFRAVSFPLDADGQPHSYEVDLEREAHWHGRINGLRVAVDAGSLHVGHGAALASPDPYRSMSLSGETLPSLPGGERLAVPLPAGLDPATVFDVRLGLIPEYAHRGVTGVFRASLEDATGHSQPWFEQRVEGQGGARWIALRRTLPAAATAAAGSEPATQRLVLEATAIQDGEALPEGAAVWGSPLLVQPRRRPAGGAGPAGRDGRNGRNLVVILVDTLRADEVGAYGGGAGLTPRLDAMARGGVRFAEMLSPAPWTLPSVCSLLTGLQPQTHGAGERFADLDPASPRQNDFAPRGLPNGVRTLAGVLGENGFYSLGVYENFYILPGFGVHQGFDEYTSVEDRAQALVDLALQRLRAVAPDRRTFLYLHLFDLHSPYDAPQPECHDVAARLEPGYRGKIGCEGDRNPERTSIPPAADRPWFHALYRADVAYVDRQLGRFFDGLRSLGLADDTVVALVSDHGEEFWSRLPQEESLGYETNSDHGHTFYQELLHVPAIVSVPGLAPRVVSEPVQMVDLFPTLLRAVGVTPPPSQGSDLTALMQGATARDRPTFVADVILHGRPRWSVRRGPWKLMVARDPALPVELYDLEHDPGETVNLAVRQARLAAEMRAWGERELAARRRARPQFIADGDVLGATYLEWRYITKLRALGYLK